MQNTDFYLCYVYSVRKIIYAYGLKGMWKTVNFLVPKIKMFVP